MGRVFVPGEQKGREPVQDYNEVHVMDLDETKRAKVEFWTAKKLGERLMREYPRREWGVMVDAEAGMVVIMCPSVSLTKGYHLHLRSDTILQLEERAVRAAGEILERHGVSRGRVVDTDAIEALPRTLRDDVIAPDAAPEPVTRVVH